MWLVGPEMSQKHHLSTHAVRANVQARCYRGTTSQFLSSEHAPRQADAPPPPGGGSARAPAGRRAGAAPDAASPKVLVVGFNTGMASGDQRLRASWAADLQRVLAHGWVAVFTCANDHADLKGERAIMEKELPGVRYVLFPRKNPFAAVTVLHPPGQRDSAWYCANAYAYAVRMVEAQQPPPAATVGGAGVCGALRERASPVPGHNVLCERARTHCACAGAAAAAAGGPARARCWGRQPWRQRQGAPRRPA